MGRHVLEAMLSSLATLDTAQTFVERKTFGAGLGVGGTGNPFELDKPSAKVARILMVSEGSTGHEFQVRGAGWSDDSFAFYQGVNNATPLFKVSNRGIVVGPSSLPGVVPLTVHGAVSQTGDLQQWRDSAGTVLAKVNNLGALTVPFLSSAGTLGSISTSTSGNNLNFSRSAGNYITATGAAGTLNIGVAANVNVMSIGATGQISISAAAAGVIPVVVQGFAAQTADLQQWRDSAGVTLGNMSAAGVLGVGSSTGNGYLLAVPGSSSNTGYVGFFSAAGTRLGLIGNSTLSANLLRADAAPWMAISATAAISPFLIRGAVSQTADLQQWQNSAGTTLSRVAANGTIEAPTGTQLGTGSNLFFGSLASTIPIVARGRASQTADLQQWQSSAGTALLYVAAGGAVVSKTTSQDSILFGGSASGTNRLYAQQTGAPVLVVGAMAGQTADLQQWQDSAGAVLTRISASGAIVTNSNVQTLNFTGNANTGPYIQIGTTGVNVIGRSAAGTNVPLSVSGMAGQVVDLQRWKDVDNNVLASVSSIGRLAATFVEGFKTLELGAADSAGAGFRTVRVPN